MASAKISRRALIRLAGLFSGAIAALPLTLGAARASASAKQGSITPDRLARPRGSQLPTGGIYDHETQQMKGYDLKLADTGTATDEDQGSSTTFWDGERK